MGEKREEHSPDRRSSMCKGPVAGRNLAQLHENRWNIDCYVIGLEG